MAAAAAQPKLLGTADNVSAESIGDGNVDFIGMTAEMSVDGNGDDSPPSAAVLGLGDDAFPLSALEQEPDAGEPDIAADTGDESAESAESAPSDAKSPADARAQRRRGRRGGRRGRGRGPSGPGGSRDEGGDAGNGPPSSGQE